MPPPGSWAELLRETLGDKKSTQRYTEAAAWCLVRESPPPGAPDEQRAPDGRSDAVDVLAAAKARLILLPVPAEVRTAILRKAKELAETPIVANRFADAAEMCPSAADVADKATRDHAAGCAARAKPKKSEEYGLPILDEFFLEFPDFPLGGSKQPAILVCALDFLVAAGRAVVDDEVQRPPRSFPAPLLPCPAPSSPRRSAPATRRERTPQTPRPIQ